MLKIFRILKRSLFPAGAKVAPLPLVFITVSLIAVLQIWSNSIIRAGMFSAGILINEIIIIAGVPLFLVIFLKYDSTRLVPLKFPGALSLIFVIIVIFGVVIDMDYLTVASEHFFPLPEHIKQIFAEMMTTRSGVEIIWKTFLLCIVPAVCEEIYFRGFCQTSIAAKFGNAPAILITAALFAVLHGNPWYLHLYFLLGVVLCWIYAVTGTLWAPILAHFLNNAWTFLNHVRGFEVPLGARFGVTDFVFLFCGAILLIGGAMLLDLKMRPQLVHKIKKNKKSLSSR